MLTISDTPIKVWTTQPLRLQRNFSDEFKEVPAGTCLFISEDQSWVYGGFLVVYGNGIFDVVAVDHLTFEHGIKQYQRGHGTNARGA